MQMVIFDQNILMPTLSTCSNWSLNLTPWSFCIVCKTRSKWSFWGWPTLQKPSQLLIIKIQSDNLLTRTRSNPLLNFSKQFSFCKPMPQGGVKEYWHHTHVLFWQNLNQMFLRALCRTRCGQNQSQTNPMLHLLLSPTISCKLELGAS